MYKCSECGTEYEIKPDYCECGNDTFVEITKVNNSSKIQPAHQTVNKKEIKSEKLVIDWIPLTVLMISIILSLFILFFVGNSQNNDVNSDKKTEQNLTILEIPNIDTFWDDAPVKVTEPLKENTEEPEAPIVKTIEDIKQIFTPKVTQPTQKPKTEVQKTAPKITVKPQATKTTPKQQPVKQTTAPVVNTIQTSSQDITNLTNRVKNNISYSNNQTTQNKQIVSQTTNHTNQSKSSTQNTTTTQTPATVIVNTAKTQTTSVKQNPQQSVIPQKSAKEIKQEYTNYKISLQNTIGKKINFARVVGDGECTVSFKLDSSGKLTNRAFTQQSSNLTLNDAVYSAMMSTPSYSAPPEGYKNETLNLKIKFYDGNFSIRLD